MRAPDFWGEPPGFVSGLLAPVGAALDAASRLRRAVARPYQAPVPVICVGNLVAGGAGKTPVVLSLAERLRRHDVAVHIVMRGYGGTLAGPVKVDAAAHSAAQVGDEALLGAEQAPCWVARDRAAGVRAAAASGARAVVLDDGFQNPSVAKDVSLVVVDGAYGFGNGRLLPAGPLRERIEDGLTRAGAVVLLGGDEAGHPAELRGFDKPILRARLVPVGGERFAGARVVAFAGIGRPAKFFATLRRLGAELVCERAFPDHHRFTDGEIAGLRSTAERDGAQLVTTHKDWVRLRPEQRAGIEILHVEIRWDDEPSLTSLLAPVLCGHDMDAARPRLDGG
jgi:tetraacyldisaccharide 4'-kinase